MILCRLLQTIGTSTHPSYGTYHDPVCGGTLSTSMPLNNSIIFVSSEAFTLTAGHQDPLKGTVQLELVLKDVKHQRPRSNRYRLPITPYILHTMLAVLLQNPKDYNNIMLWAACCLGFFAFLLQPGTCHLRTSLSTAMHPLPCLR